MLSKLENKLQINIRQHVSGGFWMILAQFLHFTATFALTWVFANYLSKEVYGQYRFLLTICSVLSLTTLPGLNVALAHAVSRDLRGTIYKVLKSRIVWGILGSLGAIVGSLYYFYMGNTELGWLFLIAAVGIPVYDTFSLYQHYLQGAKDFKLQSILRVTQRVSLVILLITAIFFKLPILGIFSIFLISSTLLDILLLRLSLKKYPANNLTDDNTISYGKSISLITAIRLGTGYLDKIVLWYLAGPAQLAIYVIAVAIPNELVTASSQFSRIAFPNMTQYSKKEIDSRLLHKYFLYSLAVIPISLFYFLSAPTIFNFLFPQYNDSIFMSKVASILILFAPAGLLIQYFYAVKDTLSLKIISISEPILLISGYLILVPIYGAFGVLLSLIFKVSISTIISLILFKFKKTSI